MIYRYIINLIGCQKIVAIVGSIVSGYKWPLEDTAGGHGLGWVQNHNAGLRTQPDSSVVVFRHGIDLAVLCRGTALVGKFAVVYRAVIGCVCISFVVVQYGQA